MDDKAGWRVAVASSDGKVVNQHFGHADTFYILEADLHGGMHYIETRRIPPVCDGGSHEPRMMHHAAERLQDCRYLLAARIGPGAASALRRQGVIPLAKPGWIRDAVKEVQEYEAVRQMLERAGDHETEEVKERK